MKNGLNIYYIFCSFIKRNAFHFFVIIITADVGILDYIPIIGTIITYYVYVLVPIGVLHFEID